MLSCGSYAVNPLPTPRELMNGRKDQHDHGSTGRTEPTLGNLDNLDGPAPKSREDDGLPKFTLDPDMRRGGGSPRPPVRRPKRRGWLVPVALLIVIGYLVDPSSRAMACRGAAGRVPLGGRCPSARFVR